MRRRDVRGAGDLLELYARVRDVFVEEAARTGLPVGDIAARTGFKSVYHFSRRVKGQAGAPPTQVRRNVWI
jgi:transcriptional regulator GlxA family with amidase domain